MKKKIMLYLLAVAISTLLIFHDCILYELVRSEKTSLCASGVLGIIGVCGLDAEAVDDHLSSSRMVVRFAVKDIGYDKSFFSFQTSHNVILNTHYKEYACFLMQKVLLEKNIT